MHCTGHTLSRKYHLSKLQKHKRFCLTFVNWTCLWDWIHICESDRVIIQWICKIFPISNTKNGVIIWSELLVKSDSFVEPDMHLSLSYIVHLISCYKTLKPEKVVLYISVCKLSLICSFIICCELTFLMTLQPWTSTIRRKKWTLFEKWFQTKWVNHAYIAK